MTILCLNLIFHSVKFDLDDGGVSGFYRCIKGRCGSRNAARDALCGTAD